MKCVWLFFVMYYVYILYSKSSDIFYVGHTDDVMRRLEEHNFLSENSFTSKNRPWEIMAYFPIGCDRGVAMKVESHIKRMKSKNYIKEILSRGNIDLIIERYSVG